MPDRFVKLEVLSTRGLVFEVRFWLEKGQAFRSFCTCEAGFKKIHCVHRLDVLAGDFSMVTHEVSESDREFIKESLTSSEAGRLLDDVHALEAEVARAKRNLKVARERFDEEFCRMPFRE